MEAKAVNIFEYLDFRSFLTDYFEQRRQIDTTFTKAFVAKKIGLPNSRSYFVDILNGTKRLSNIKMELLIGLLGLNPEEANYFRFLVQYNQTEIPAEKDFFYSRLIELEKTPKKYVDVKLYRTYYENWYHSAIRALLDVVDCRDDYNGIGKKLIPSINARKVENSIRLLYNLGMIGRNENGFWKPTQKIISARIESKTDLLKQYQIENLEIAKHAIRAAKDPTSFFSTKTLSISPAAYSKVMERMEEFKREVSSIINMDDKPAEFVYQMNIQLYPASRR
jgi:uncharacterized protein (TIGR02147 family)